MRHTVFLSLTLAVLWLVNSGHYNGLILCLGAVSIALIVWIAHKMDVVDEEAQPLNLSLKLPAYWLWLLKEIVVSNIDVVKHVWAGTGSIDPCVASLKISQKTDIGRVIYANSITLTPGTVSIDLQDDYVTVLALSREGMEALRKGEMDRRVSELER